MDAENVYIFSAEKSVFWPKGDFSEVETRRKTGCLTQLKAQVSLPLDFHFFINQVRPGPVFYYPLLLSGDEFITRCMPGLSFAFPSPQFEYRRHTSESIE
jgi:hypothetical protein